MAVGILGASQAALYGALDVGFLEGVAEQTVGCGLMICLLDVDSEAANMTRADVPLTQKKFFLTTFWVTPIATGTPYG